MSSSPPVAVPTPVRVASIVGFLVVTELASGITQGWISPLLPSFIERYGLTSADANWISASALLSTVVCVPLLSKLGDVYGHKRLLVLAASLVALGSVIVALAPSFALLLVGRVLQGAITAFLPLEFAIVRERAGERAGRAVGLLVGALTIGASLGLLLAGVARQFLGLTATLWIPAVMMIVVVPLLARLVPETTVRKPGGIDWPGAVLLAVGLVLFLGAVGNGSRWGWGDARTLVGILGGLALLAVWVRVENRTTHPLVPLDVLRRGGQGLPLLTAFVFGAHLFGSSAPTAVFLGTDPAATGFGLGLTGAALGGALLVLGASMFLATTIAARLTQRVGETAVLVTGTLISAASYLLAALLHFDVALVLLWQAGLGFGGGLVAATLPTIVVERAPRDSVGILSGLYNTARTAAGAVAGAVFAAVMSALVMTGSNGKVVAAESAYVAVWCICAGLAIVVAALAIGVRRGARAARAARAAQVEVAARGPRVTVAVRPRELRSVLDLFAIGIGPSSSHTVGPMRAAAAFARTLGPDVTRLHVELLGSLGSTGIGHGTPDAVVAGLRGLDPATCDPAEVHGSWAALGDGRLLRLASGHAVSVRTEDVRLVPGERLPGHPNALRMRAWRTGAVTERIFYSVGGGAVVEEGTVAEDRTVALPHPYTTAAELLDHCIAERCDIAEIVRRNETARHGPELDRGLTERWAAMRACLTAGLGAHGTLPGGLGTRRRAGALATALRADAVPLDSPEWLSAYAMAVNEENAAGHRVVTAPTNGAAGILPAVLHHHLTATRAREAEAVPRFLLTAAAVGGIVAHNASISGADIGCQGEVGSAAAMAAAGYCAVLGGAPAVVANAAEIALEHHLGLTCDPVAGLVQIPCIERNAIAAGTAVNAARLALRGTGAHRVPLDVAVETMRLTGRDMSHRYKETSDGGLAVTVPYC